MGKGVTSIRLQYHNRPQRRLCLPTSMVVSSASCVQPYARRSANRHQRKDVNSNTGGNTSILCRINNRYAL
ncbi:hypothetical protein L917_14157 [Phytophthora nicotianae]|uniref:Uncharacterized protein n=1 Tax=Phytophthora nicotianae TaxID=4792 RepID=W2KP78_PHYNI|nr:hypothetical protein L917_14157 [Phytophthora nicotianae]